MKLIIISFFFVSFNVFAGNLSDLIGGSSTKKVTFAGYTAASYTPASVGGIRGANTICDTEYSGSRWCTYEDLFNMKSSYPWSENAHIFIPTLDRTSTCSYWSSNTSSTSFAGTYANTAGGMSALQCASLSVKIACCFN